MIKLINTQMNDINIRYYSDTYIFERVEGNEIEEISVQVDHIEDEEDNALYGITVSTQDDISDLERKEIEKLILGSFKNFDITNNNIIWLGDAISQSVKNWIESRGE
jgi:hypothetical protein